MVEVPGMKMDLSQSLPFSCRQSIKSPLYGILRVLAAGFWAEKVDFFAANPQNRRSTAFCVYWRSGWRQGRGWPSRSSRKRPTRSLDVQLLLFVPLTRAERRRTRSVMPRSRHRSLHKARRTLPFPPMRSVSPPALHPSCPT